jgi:cytochrome c-type biogenesis protein CcmE
MESVFETPPVSRRRRGARWRVFAGVALILAAVVLLVVRAREDSVVYYVTVSELLARPAAAETRGLRMTGKVVPGSVERAGRRLSFRVTDGAQMMPVSYEGVVPETFTEESEVVVEGRYVPTAGFEANGLLTKCPSKYQADSTPTQQTHPDGIPKTGR